MPSPLGLALPLAAVLVAALPGVARAAPRLVFSQDDPAGDATGPGGYVPPGDPDLEEGDFDLRRFAVLVDGEDVVLEVTLGARVRRPASTQRTNASPLDLDAGLYLQNVDVYVDTDRSEGSGSGACIPGRRVAFAGGRTWERAVVLSPQPGAVREVIDEAMGAAAAQVHVARRVEARGRTLVARVPASFFGASPREDWGWSVQVSGARWERTLALADHVRGAHEADAFTMPVLPVREAWAFGGAPRGEAHPRVVDVLLPAGADQRAVLGSFDVAAGSWARVPFVDGATGPAPGAAVPPPGPAAQPSAAAGPALRVVDVSGDLVTLEGPTAGLVPLRLGRVLDGAGETVARVAVVRVLGAGLVASAVEGRERIARGQQVAFDPPAPAEAAPPASPSRSPR